MGLHRNPILALNSATSTSWDRGVRACTPPRRSCRHRCDRKVRTGNGEEGLAVCLDEQPGTPGDDALHFHGPIPTQSGILRQDQAVAVHTSGRPRRFPLRLQAGRLLGSRLAAANTVKHLVPRNPAGTISIQVIQTPVEFLALRRSQRNGARRPREVFPYFVQERKLLFRT